MPVLLRIISIALFAVASTQLLFAESRIQWKFQKGSVQKQELVMDQVLATKLPGQNRSETKITQQLSLELSCDDVTPEGMASVRQKLTRLEAKFEFPAPLNKTVKFDSDKKSAGNDPILVQLDKTLRPMLGVNWTMSIDNRGKISKVTVPQEFLDTLQQSGVAAAGGDMFTEEGLQRMSEQSSIQFPEGELQIDDTWSTPIELKSPIGLMKMIRECKYVGLDSKTGKEQFDVKVAIELDADPASAVKVTLKSGSGTGVILFDAEKGQIHESHISTTMKMEIPVGAQTIEQDVTSDVLLRTVTDKAEAK